jgi:V8-like Glu-specific endopeptidase
METGTRATLSHRFNLLAPLLLTPLLGCVEPPEQGRGTPAWAGEDEDSEGEPAELPPDDLPESRIYGGAPVGACGWPTTVSLGGSCTGTLVHPQVVLYAAHCGDDYSSVRFGEKVSGSGGRSVATSFCEVYPSGGPGDGHDFAFCKLAQPVNDVPIVPIAMGCETDEIAAGKAVTMVGFGEADNGPYGVKRWVNSTVSSISSQDEVFIGGGGKDTCQGDSGGPVFMQVDDGNTSSWRVFGITSYGGACGGGGYYSQMHIGVPWFEDMAGVDLTPCHDADGTWNPSADCTEFPLTPNVGSGTWANGCSGGALSGASEMCGEGIGGGDPQPEPEPDCETCQTLHGTLSGKNDSDVQPGGNYYQSTTAGNHIAELDGPNGVDFDLSLLKWSGGKWTTVASATTGAPDETITYAGGVGYYAWIVKSYSGAGTYQLMIDVPG